MHIINLPPLSGDVLSPCQPRHPDLRSDLRTLHPDLRSDLRQQLALRYNDIRIRFSSYVNFVRRALQRGGVTARALSTSLLTLPAFDANPGQPGSDRENIALLAEAREKLEKADSVCDIFITLSSRFLTSFLNYDIYEHMIEEFDLDRSHEKMRYPKHLRAYVEKHKIAEFVAINPRLADVSLSSKELAVKFDCDPRHTPASRIVQLKEAVAGVLGTRSSALRIYSVEEGCVVIRFLVSACIADIVFEGSELSSEQVEGFRNLSALWLKCGGTAVSFREGVRIEDGDCQLHQTGQSS